MGVLRKLFRRVRRRARWECIACGHVATFEELVRDRCPRCMGPVLLSVFLHPFQLR